MNLFIFENILFKKSSREQPTKRLIKLFCTTLSTMGLLFCLSRGPAIINKMTANNWEAPFEVVLTAGRGQCQFSVSASRLTLNSWLLIRAVQQPRRICKSVAALSIAAVSASASPLLVSCPFCDQSRCWSTGPHRAEPAQPCRFREGSTGR